MEVAQTHIVNARIANAIHAFAQKKIQLMVAAIKTMIKIKNVVAAISEKVHTSRVLQESR